MSYTGLSYLGPIRATGKEVVDNNYVLHWTVLPGADTSYRKRNEGRSLCPTLDSPTWGRYELQARKEGQFYINVKHYDHDRGESVAEWREHLKTDRLNKAERCFRGSQ